MSRKSSSLRITFLLILFIGGSGVLGLLILDRLEEGKATASIPKNKKKIISVEVAPVERGAMKVRRSFSGALEAWAQFVVAPKVAGRVERIMVNLSDVVQRGQVVAILDSEEFSQEVQMAEADLRVAQANLAEAKSALEISNREAARFEELRDSGIISASRFDSALSDKLGKQAELDVAMARLNRAESEVKAAEIRLGYNQVTANWFGGSDRRTVAERYIDEGETVSANKPLLNIVELDPIKAVIFVAEQDYAHLHQGQAAIVSTDVFPGERFKGRIDRISPMFREATRQARVELTINNPAMHLKPGMFVRVTVVLKRIRNTAHVPEQALHVRDDKKGVFIVSPDGKSVRWQEVTVGIRSEGRAQITGEGLNGRVVLLGQRLLDDGSPVHIVNHRHDPRKPAPVKP